MDEYTPCKKPDPTAREAIGNVMRILRTQRKKPNKYNARKTTVCGRTFDSKRESEWYMMLREKHRLGKIKHFECQPTYTLLEGFRDNQGKQQKPITYTPDFLVEYDDGRREVIEVKGVRTRDYLLRKKLFLYMMRKTDIVFREVR
nr:MAG TPA: Endonuclease [Caudoviricetes sp.]